MTDLREKSTFVNTIGSWLLTIPIALVGILMVELFCRFLFPSLGWNTLSRDRRIIFFDGPSTIFQNHKDIFTYLPHSEIRNVTGYFTDHGFSIAHDYSFRTNNFGLVQETDIMPGRDSLMLLGDSFTEGEGADPWFPLVSSDITKFGYQPINGGVLGTGFQQWRKLDRYLAAENIRVRKLVVLFISDDYHRPVWNIRPATFECLSTPPLCRVEYSQFLRWPPAEQLSSWIDRIRAARGPPDPGMKMSTAARLLPASYSVYMFFRRIAMLARAEQGSHAAIIDLLRIYGAENVAFLHLPQKDEIGHGPSSLGLKARHDIEEAGGKLFDGFQLCQMEKTDYQLNDAHPNKEGYNKIAACAAEVIKALVTTGDQGDASRKSHPQRRG